MTCIYTLYNYRGRTFVSGGESIPTRRGTTLPTMLIVGTDKTAILNNLPDRFLLIDDGPLIDSISLPQRRKIISFDVTKHFLHPLKHIDYRKAREFISVLDAIFPEGQNTLTKRNANFVLLQSLLSNPRSLETLIHVKKDNPGTLDAFQKIQTLLLSPVLNRVLTRSTNFSFDGIILARLNRAELGDFDCFVLGNLLISHYKHTVIIPDFGFYGCKHHAQLIREHRLRAGVNFLDESPLKNTLLLMEPKLGRHCTAEDADVLASYAGHKKDSQGRSEFVERAIE